MCHTRLTVWYPNKPQWWVIWITSGLAYFVFYARNADESQLVVSVFMGPQAPWGYLWIGALLVWQLSRYGSGSKK
jgi:hypothetical protein